MRKSNAEDLVNLMSSLSIRIRSQLFRDSEIQSTSSTADIESWICIEEEEDVQKEMIDDEMDELEEGISHLSVRHASTILDVEDDGDTVVCAPIPSAVEMAVQFQPLEEVCFDCNLPEVGVYLKRAKREIEAQRKERSSGISCQLLLSELWSICK